MSLRFKILFALAGAAALSCWVVRRVVVAGESMVPTLQPGDRLIVTRVRRIRPGALVLVDDPRPGSDRLLIKRVSGQRGRLVEVLGDNPSSSTDTRAFGALRRSAIVGSVLYRYAPPERAGRVH
ncbi:MAG: nickel-type superoxide dismutase maturation protease [Acidimicrobiales bacterium]